MTVSEAKSSFNEMLGPVIGGEMLGSFVYEPKTRSVLLTFAFVPIVPLPFKISHDELQGIVMIYDGA